MIQFINRWCPSWGWLKTLDLRYQKQIRQNVILRELKKCTFFELFRNCTEYIWIWEKTHSKWDAIETFWTYNELLIWASFTILLCNWSRVSCVTVCTAPGHDLHVEPLAWQSFWCRQGRTGRTSWENTSWHHHSTMNTSSFQCFLAMDVSTSLLGWGWGVRPFAKFMSYWSMACRAENSSNHATCFDEKWSLYFGASLWSSIHLGRKRANTTRFFLLALRVQRTLCNSLENHWGTILLLLED